MPVTELRFSAVTFHGQFVMEMRADCPSPASGPAAQAATPARRGSPASFRKVRSASSIVGKSAVRRTEGGGISNPPSTAARARAKRALVPPISATSRSPSPLPSLIIVQRPPQLAGLAKWPRVRRENHRAIARHLVSSAAPSRHRSALAFPEGSYSARSEERRPHPLYHKG